MKEFNFDETGAGDILKLLEFAGKGFILLGIALAAIIVVFILFEEHNDRPSDSSKKNSEEGGGDSSGNGE